MRWASSAFALAAVLFSTHVSADPLQKSDDIVKFFTGQGNLGVQILLSERDSSLRFREIDLGLAKLGCQLQILGLRDR